MHSNDFIWYPNRFYEVKVLKSIRNLMMFIFFTIRRGGLNGKFY